MEIIDRYVYAVTTKLPEKGKQEIEQEIKSLIYDMMDKYLYEPDEEKRAILVIKELGDPEKLANEYKEKELYLIGPKYFNNYILVLKIVSFALIISMVIGLVIQVFFVNEISIAQIIANFTSRVFSGLLQGGAWVTIIFVVLERNKVNLKDKNWNIKDLPSLPAKGAKISKGDSIFEIIFASIFIGMLYFSPQLISIYINVNNVNTDIPIFNMDVVNTFKFIIIISLVIVLLKGILKLIWGRWTVNRSIILSILEIVSAGFAIVFFSNINIWNESLISVVEKYAPVSFLTTIKWIIIIIIIAAGIDVLINMYKGYKYGRYKYN